MPPIKQSVHSCGTCTTQEEEGYYYVWIPYLIHHQLNQNKHQLTFDRRVAKLEQKLDGVVALLTAAKRLPKNDETQSQLSSPKSSIFSSSADRSASGVPFFPPIRPEEVGKTLEFSSSLERSLFIPSGLSQTIQESNFLPDQERNLFFSGYDFTKFTLEEAEILLTAFRTEMVAHFPFVVVPPEMTAQGLCNEKPFLFMSIMTAASYRNMARQRALGEEVMKYISAHILLRGEKSLELLQGILVFLSWFVLEFICRLYSTCFP
jgi:hypothetical protein